MNARGHILAILDRFDRKPGELEPMIEDELSRVAVDHRDRRFIFETIYGIIRNRLRIDFVIDQFVSDWRKARSPALQRILQLGLYQVLYLDRVPDHAAVNETVLCAKTDRRTFRYAGMVNAVLRNVIKSRHQLPVPGADLPLARRLSIEYSHPEWLTARWLERFGLANVKKLLAFNNRIPGIYLRRKMRGLTTRAFETEVKPICGPAEGYKNLYFRLDKGLLPEKIAILEQGICTVQSPSSGWVVALCDIHPGETVLDLCAAPGGKATLVADLSGSDGAVFACDLQPHRLRMVRETAARLRAETVLCVAADGRMAPFKPGFTKILLDAPCTGTGVIQRHPDARWCRTEADIGRVAQLQRGLLRSSAGLLAAGGILVYSTCSLEAEENERQVEWFLREFPQFSVEKPPSAVPSQYVNLDGCLFIKPFEHDLDGMFGVRLRKNG